MNIIINGRHLEITDSMKSEAEKRISHELSRYDNLITSVRAVLEKEKRDFSVEILLHINGHEVVSKVTGLEFYPAFDSALAKVHTQLAKIMDKIQSRHHAQPLRDATESL